jgi:hypothetical protein
MLFGFYCVSIKEKAAILSMFSDTQNLPMAFKRNTKIYSYCYERYVIDRVTLLAIFFFFPPN